MFIVLMGDIPYTRCVGGWHARYAEYLESMFHQLDSGHSMKISQSDPYFGPPYGVLRV